MMTKRTQGPISLIAGPQELLKVAAPPLGGGVGEEGNAVSHQGAALHLHDGGPIPGQVDVEPAPPKRWLDFDEVVAGELRELS